MAKRTTEAVGTALEDERLERIARTVPVGFFETDVHGLVTFVSPQWCSIFALSDESACGRGWLEAVHPQDRKQVEAAWNDAVARGSGLEVVYRLRSDNDLLCVQTSSIPITDAAGLVTGFAGATVDVTRAIHGDTHPRGDQLAALAEVMPQLMWIAGADGSIQYFNRPWLDYTGLTLELMQQSGVKNVVHPDDLGLTWERWNSALVNGAAYEMEYRLRNAQTGTYRWFIARATPYRDARGEIVRWIGTATDIDAQKRANENLRFLVDASNALSAKFDVGAVCATLAEIAIASVADWCFVVLSREDGGYLTKAIAHRVPDRVRFLEQVRERYPVREGGPLDRAIRHNTPILIPSIDERELAAAAEDAEHLHILRSLGLHAAMLLPLSSSDGTVYGGIAIASSESARSYTADDLEVAEMVARRAAAAIHTASVLEHERSRADRLAFLSQASEILAEATDMQTLLDRLTRFITGSMADLAYVTLVENQEALRTIACAHAEADKAAIAERLRGQRTLRPEAEEQAILELSQRRTLLHKSVPLDAPISVTWEYLASDVRALDVRSAITVPLFCRGETYGALVVHFCGPHARAYNEDDAALFTDLGRRLSLAIEHQRTLERERRIAESLQKALLPQPGMLPTAKSLQFAESYRPSSREAEVGGDWYDAVTLPDGSILVSVGDVMGRGLQAAGLMGKLRQAIGMTALYERDPARILDAVDFHLRSRGSQTFATAFVGIIDAGHRVLRYADAGHPSALLRKNDELIELHSDGLPLGLRDADGPQQSSEVSLDGAQLLVLYTDGLVESTGDLLFGEQRLAMLASSQAISFVRNPAEFLCDACLPPDAQDDTAVLTVSFGERTSWAFDAENAKAAHEVRSELVAYLRERAPQLDFEAAQLVFGELVGNVVRHAPGAIEVQIEFAGAKPVLHVIDRGHGFLRDPSLPLDPLSECGRGLYIVSQLTENFTVERIAGYGNHVAATLKMENCVLE